MSGRRRRFAYLLVIAAVAFAAVTATFAKANTAVTTKKSDTVLTIMGFGTGDDVAETRAKLAIAAVGGDV
jgi:ABC-type glycerol-3-phosphate transport system substrate-binding protein